jgi:hypothetical protein
MWSPSLTALSSLKWQAIMRDQLLNLAPFKLANMHANMKQSFPLFHIANTSIPPEKRQRAKILAGTRKAVAHTRRDVPSPHATP